MTSHVVEHNGADEWAAKVATRVSEIVRTGPLVRQKDGKLGEHQGQTRRTKGSRSLDRTAKYQSSENSMGETMERMRRAKPTAG